MHGFLCVNAYGGPQSETIFTGETKRFLISRYLLVGLKVLKDPGIILSKKINHSNVLPM